MIMNWVFVKNSILTEEMLHFNGICYNNWVNMMFFHESSKLKQKLVLYYIV
jgi:hypothetical protein